MRKINKSVLFCMIFSLSILFVAGCSCTKETKVQYILFDEPVIDLFVGDVYEANATVVPSDASNNKVVYTLENPTDNGETIKVLEKTGDNQFTAVTEGEAILYATSVEIGNRSRIEQTVRVFSSRIQLDAPIGLRYDGEKVVWDKVTYSLANNDYEAFGYIVTLNGVEQPISTLNEISGLVPGIENKIKVKAVGNSELIDDSVYSSEISVYILPSPTNIQRLGTTLSWNSVDYAGSYDIYVNDEVYLQNIEANSADIDFETSGNYAVRVVANPEVGSEFKYPSYPSESISIEKLDKVQNISISENVARWNEVIKAVEYKLVLENDNNTYEYDTGVYTTFDLGNIIPTIESGDYNLSIIAVSNATSGINSHKSEPVEITKLATPNNFRVENNELVWDTVENAVKYSITVNGSDAINVRDSYSLPENSEAGEYLFKIIAYGDGERYFNSSWTKDEDAYLAIKLDSPETITNYNSTITSELIENAQTYIYYDVADENNFIEFTENDISNSSTTETNISTTLILKDKVVRQSEEPYWQLQEKLSQNYYKIKVKAVATSGENYFDSNISDSYVEFYKLFAPEEFTMIYAESIFVYSNVISIDGMSDAKSKELYQAIDKINDHTLISNIRYQQYEDGKLVDRFVHRVDGTTSGITQEENDKVKGGPIYISMNYVGNGTTVIDSDYFGVRLALDWGVHKLSNAYFINQFSAEPVVIDRMYEPVDFYMDSTNLRFYSGGSDNEKYVLYLKDNATERYSKIAESEENNIDLNELINGSGLFDLSIVTLPTDNTDYSDSLIENEEFIYGTATEQDRFRFASKYVDIQVTRLQAPVVSLNDGYIEWEQIEGAGGYQIYVNNSVVNNARIIEDGTKLKWYCNIYDTDSLEVKVVAKAPHSHDAEELVMDSMSSNTINYARLVVTGYEIANDILTVQTNEENVYLFASAYNIGTREYTEITSNALSIDLSAEIKKAGNYIIMFYISLIPEVEQNKLNSSPIGLSGDIAFTILGNSAVLYNSENYYLLWSEIENATSYKVVFREKGSEEFNESEIINGLSADLSLIPGIKGNTTYEVSIRSVGNGTDIISSYPDFESNSVEFIRMSEVVNFTGTSAGENYELSWTAIENASYDIYLNEEFIENVTTNSYAYALSNMVNPGEYNFTVRTVSTDATKATSYYSEAVTVVRLDAPNIAINNGVLVVSNYDSENYQVRLNILDNTNANIYTEKYSVSEIVLDDIVALTTGNYTLVVNFEGDGTSYLDGATNSLSNISRVESVQNFVLSSTNMRLEWTAIDGVTNYKVVYYTSGSSEKIIEFANNSFINISSAVNSGLNNVVVYAVGNSDSKINSLASNVISFTKLPVPTDVKVENGTLTFNQVENVDNYIVSITKDDNETLSDYMYDADGFDIDLTDVGNYSIKVSAKGDYVSTVSSNFSETINITKLANVTNIQVQNNQITWDSVESAYKYKLVFSGASNYEVEVEECLYNIETDKLIAGTYDVEIIAIGDGTNILAGQGVVNDDLITILSAPTNITFNSEKQLVWDSVTGAVSYVVEIIDANNNEVMYDSIANQLDLPKNLVVGSYNVIISAIGNGLEIIDSVESNTFVFTKLDVPETLTHKSGVITLGVVNGVENYIIEVVNEQGDKQILNATNSNLSATCTFESAGLYTISAYSKGDYITTIDSDVSTSITVRKLEEPIVSIENNVISWTENEYVKENNFNYKIIIYNNNIEVYSKESTETSLSFDLEELLNGSYKVEVQSMAGDETLFMPSEMAVLTGMTKFAQPEIDENITNNKITWTISLTDAELLAVTGYEVKVVDKDGKESFTTITNINEKEYEIGDNFESGKYKISVRVLGDGQSYIRSLFSAEKEVYKLENPDVQICRQNTSVSTSPYIATWNEVTGASSYVVVFNNNQTYETINNYIVLDDIATLPVGNNSVRIIVNGDATYYVDSKISAESTFTVLDSESVNLRIENGIIIWDSIDNSKLYELSLNETKVNCGLNTSYELPSVFNNGVYTIKLKVIAKDNSGKQNVVVNSHYSLAIEGYKLATPNSPVIVNGELKMSVVEYKNLEEEFSNRLNYQIQYGNYDEVVVLDKDNLVNKTIYSDKVNTNCEIRYRAIGDSYNLNSDWTSAYNTVYGTELPVATNVYMQNNVLSWDAVSNASKYRLVAKVVDAIGEVGENQYVLDVDTTSIEYPFYYDEFKESGVTLSIEVIAIGTLNSSGASSVYTNSKGAEYVVQYLQQATELVSQDGILMWTGTSYNGYEIEIDGVSKTIMANYYTFENESTGKHTVKVRLKGNGNEVVDGEWSNYAIIYKIDTPTYYIDTFLNDGKIAWKTSKSFLEDYADEIPLDKLFNYVQILLTSPTTEDIVLSKSDFDTEIDGDYYLSVLNEFLDDIDAGTYSFRIKNVGTNGTTDLDRFINSVYANEFIATILSAPQNVVVENGILRWDNVENNNGYNIYIDKQNGTVETLTLPKAQNQDSCYVDLRDYAIGKYSFTIRALGDSETYLTSAKSEEVKTEVLSAPTVIDLDEGTLTWLAIEGADTYNVKVINTVNNAEVIFENQIPIYINGRAYYELSDTLQAGSYDIYVMSVGNGVEYISSKYMTEPKRVTKLASVENFGNTLGKLTWEQSTNSNGDLITGYMINIQSINSDLEGNNEFTIKVYTVPKDSQSAQISVVEGICYYELPSTIPFGELTIKVKALGDSENTASSSYTEGMSATKLDIVTDIFLDDGVIKWTYNTLGRSGFYLVVGNGSTAITYENNLISTYQTEFPSELPSNTYDVYLKVVGNTVTAGSTDRRYLNSNISDALEIVKLAQVNGFSAYDGVLVWNEVTGATNYELTFYKQGQNDITVNSRLYNNTLRKYYYAPIGMTNDNVARFGDGNYDRITIRALGGSNYINSQEVEITDIYKISRPSSIEVVTSENNAQELKLKWQIVSYTINETKVFVKKYRLRLIAENGQEFTAYVSYDNGDMTSSTSTLEASTFFECDINSLFDIGSGTYLLSIQACALPSLDGQGYEVWNTINSDYSVNVSVTKPAPPANLQFDDNLKAYTWTKPTLDSSLDVTYNVTYIYKQSDLAETYKVESFVTDKTYFYPSKLGVYFVAVKAIVSGNLTSDYIGKNNTTYLSIKVNLDESMTEQQSLEYFLREYGVESRHDLFDSGEGSADNPYIIKTANQLNNLNYYYIVDMYFELANNINLAGSTITIGSKDKPFAGVLDGNNCTISNLNLNGTVEAIGLFAYASGATIKDLILSNANVTISRQANTYAGLLVGYADNVNLENILISGSISQSGYGNSSASFYLGGAIGYGMGESTSINRVRNLADINFNASDTAIITYSGGIAGYYEANEGDNSGILNCANEGDISGTIAGGLVGFGICPITSSYNTGIITAYSATSSDANAGGLVGKTSTTIYNTILNTYNVGSVTANASASKNCYAGGLVGYGGASNVYNFYNSGTVTTVKPNTTVSTAGWLIGYNNRSSLYAENCYNINTGLTTISGSGTVSDGCQTINANELNNAVSVYLGSEFTYSSAKGRIVLNMESQLLG